jgi:bifunctional non-homologous end joining protein LigD
VRYLGWSDDGRLRFPSFRGIDYDRSPTDCLAGPHTADVHLPSLEAPRFKDALPLSSRSPHSSRRVVLTNQDKVFWPKEGYTKGDVIRYYEAVSTVLLPHLRDRPVVLVRYPDGIEGKSFFQWNVPFGFPAWVKHLPLDSKEEGETSKRRVFLANDLDSLLVLANLGSIPIHVLACRATTQQACDFCTLDFDVGKSTLPNGVTLALTLRDILERIGLRGYPKTSGQHGLHVLIPLGPGVSFDTAQALNTLLGRLVAAEHPGIATLERVVEKRGTKVLIDIGQTGRHRTIVAPYSVRAFPGATVSTPLRWDEVTAELDPSRFTIRTVPERIAAVGDLARGVLEDAPDIRAAIGKLEGLMRG